MRAGAYGVTVITDNSGGNTMPDTELIINVGGSALKTTDFDNLIPWYALLRGADSIALAQNNVERVRVQLGGLRRFIAFRKHIDGSPPLYCIGFQETVGALVRGDVYIGGSNRKTMAWLHPSGRVDIGG